MIAMTNIPKLGKLGTQAADQPPKDLHSIACSRVGAAGTACMLPGTRDCPMAPADAQEKAQREAQRGLLQKQYPTSVAACKNADVVVLLGKGY